MKCMNCQREMYCINTREEDNVRYRLYKCKECGHLLYTMEQPGEEGYVRKKINKIIDKKKLEVL